MNIMNNFRQTGRTTRMLNAAAKLAEDPKNTVIVIFVNQNERSMWSSQPQYSKLNMVTLDQIKDKINPLTLEPISKNSNEEFFIDHAVIEVKFAKHVSYLHNYDQYLRLAELDFKTMMDQGT